MLCCARQGAAKSGQQNSSGVVAVSCRTARTACDTAPGQNRFAELCEPLSMAPRCFGLRAMNLYAKDLRP